MNWIQQKSGEH
jgi:hypothetical protein